MARKEWKGFLTFGLVNIPVYLNVGARDERVSLSTFHEPCGSPIKAPKFCEACNDRVSPDQISRGFNTGTGIVPITDEELESIAPSTEKVMEIRECVKWEQVDPIYLAESFYLLPDDAGKKAYFLLVKSLRETGRVAIAQLTKNSREHVVLIRPRDNGLVAHFIFYPNEVRRVPEFDDLKEIMLTPAEKKMAAQLVDSLTADFQPEQFEDGYAMRLNALIASKLDKSKPAPAPIKKPDTSMGDLASALEASLNRPKRRIQLDAEPPKKAAVAKSKKAGRSAA